MAEPTSGAEPVVRRAAGADETRAANRAWWDAAAEGYLAEHGGFLGDSDFVWGPEHLTEDDARLLGDVRRARVLEVGCGAAQCARWLARAGATVVGIDLSGEMLARGRAIGAQVGVDVPLVQADAMRLPFRDATFDVACSAYGAVPFVADSAAVMREVARVLRPRGRWVFAVPHPLRWSFPDDPGAAGLTARTSYWDRAAYVEQDGHGRATYAEHHRTVGDRVREIVAAGLVLDDVVEPEWPVELEETWGGWSPLRGRLIPGTAIFVTHKP